MKKTKLLPDHLNPNQTDPPPEDNKQAGEDNQNLFQPFQPAIPWQLPPRPEHFTGRKEELAWLMAELQPGRTIALCGPAGIGKTALAAEAIWRLAEGGQLRERFPDGLIFYPFYGQPDPALTLQHLARSFDATAQDTVPRFLTGKHALIVLDGTEVAVDLPAVLTAAGGCGVLITSRQQNDVPADREDLEPLSPAQAIRLFQAWTEAQFDNRAAIQTICHLVGRLPLAIRLAGHYLGQSDETEAEYLAQLQMTPLPSLDDSQRCQESVPILLAYALDRISPGARQVLAVAGLLALAPFRPGVIVTALEPSQEEMSSWLDELVNFGLLRRLTPEGEITPLAGCPYLISHPFIHAYVRQHLTVEPDQAKQIMVYYETFARHYRDQNLPGHQQLNAECRHLLALIAGCVGRDDWQSISGLVWAGEDLLNQTGHYAEQMIVLETGLTAAQHLEDRYSKSAFLGKLGLAYYAQGQLEQAIAFYQQALAIAQEIGDRHGEEAHLGNLGNAYGDLGQSEQAITCYQQALAIAQEAGDRRSEALHKWNLGLLYAESDPAQAVLLMNALVTYEREIGHPDAEADAERLAQIQARC